MILTDHHDGHGLNESIVIKTDDRDEKNGGASHAYIATINNNVVAGIQFQKGPRGTAFSISGMTENALLAIVADRLKAFNDGPYRCKENACALTKIEEAMHWLKARADERARRGVLGRNEK